MSFWKWLNLSINKVCTFCAQAFQDQRGNTSSKRIITYIAMWQLNAIAQQSFKSPIDHIVLYVYGAIVGFGIGAITTEIITAFITRTPQVPPVISAPINDQVVKVEDTKAN